MTLFSFGLLGIVTLVLLTAAVGGLLDLPSLSEFRVTLASRHVRPWALLVAFSPVLSAAFDIPEKVASFGILPASVMTTLSLVDGTFFTAALAGCWLAMDEAEDPHSRPQRAII